MIELAHISMRYGGQTVVQIPELRVEEGKRYALIGVNGCGKTTLLRIIAGMIKPTTGEVRNVPAQHMGYMPQAPYAFGFSVRKNVEIALPNSSDAPEKALRALAAVGIQHLAESRGSRLSGGETQRMAFARIIALPRQLLLLDEPTSSTDIQGLDQIEQSLLSYAQSTGCTVIFSTHSPAQAQRLSDQIIFLDRGRIAEFGATESVLKNPQNAITRLFLQHWKI